MLFIKEIEKLPDEAFAFIVGEKNSYNKYYSVSVDGQWRFCIQSPYFGINPQVAIFKNNILIGCGENFYIYSKKGNVVKKLCLPVVFHEFYVNNDSILIKDEISLTLLNADFSTEWHLEFNEFFDIIKIENEVVFINFFNTKTSKLNLKTGKSL